MTNSKSDWILPAAVWHYYSSSQTRLDLSEANIELERATMIVASGPKGQWLY